MRLVVEHNNPSDRCPSAVCAEQIKDLAERVERLIVSHRKPEHFFEEKSEIAEGLRRIASEVRHG